MAWFKFESVLWTLEFKTGDASKCNWIERIHMQNHILISGFSSFLWNLEIQKFAELFSCESWNNLFFHCDYCDFKNFLRLKASHERSLQGVQAKSYQLRILLASLKLSFYPITPSLASHTWGEKNTNKQTKNLTDDYIWLDGTKWISVLHSMSIPTEPPSAHSLSN